MGLSQPEAAELARLSDRTLSAAENGSCEMKILTLLQLCNVLNIPLEDLLQPENEPDDCRAELIRFIEKCAPSDLSRISRLIKYALRLPG